MALDLFQRLGTDETLHPQYLQTRDAPSMGPARAVLREVAATTAVVNLGQSQQPSGLVRATRSTRQHPQCRTVEIIPQANR